jgi:hypothetical protein
MARWRVDGDVRPWATSAPVPTCTSQKGDGSASPGRRFVKVTAAFGDHGLASSICDDSYQGLIGGISERISRHLGTCE